MDLLFGATVAAVGGWQLYKPTQALLILLQIWMLLRDHHIGCALLLLLARVDEVHLVIGDRATFLAEIERAWTIKQAIALGDSGRLSTLLLGRGGDRRFGMKLILMVVHLIAPPTVVVIVVLLMVLLGGGVAE